MKMRLRDIGFALAAFMAAVAVIPAAQAVGGVGKYGSIYAVNPYDTIWRDPWGVCIKTPWWSAEKEAPECGGVIAAVPIHREITLGADALFDFAKYNLKPSGMAALDQLLRDLRSPEVQSLNCIQITGYTDSIGSQAFNDRLADNRARTVADYLVQGGIPSSIVTATGKGLCCYVAPNTFPDGRDNPEGRAKNRRVEVSVDATGQIAPQKTTVQ